MAKDTERRTRILTAGTGVLIAADLIVSGTALNHLQNNQRTYEQTHLLGTDATAPSYSQWEISLPEQRQDPSDLSDKQRKPIKVFADEFIKLPDYYGQPKETGIKLEPYEFVDGSPSYKLTVAQEDPYKAHIAEYGYDEKDPSTYPSEEYLLPQNTDRLVFKNNKNETMVIKIEEPEADSEKFTLKTLPSADS